MTPCAAAQTPGFVERSPLLRAAYRLACELHHGPRRQGDTDIEHPIQVAALLDQHGFGERVVAAALLHDVLEDTAALPDEIEAQFGAEIARLVAEMSENESIDAYAPRKAEHRDRITRDRSVAAIYAADKLANARALNDDDEAPPAEKLRHYLHTLVLLQREHPDLPFLKPLQEELIALGRAERDGVNDE